MKAFFTWLCFLLLAITSVVGVLNTAAQCGLDNNFDPDGVFDMLALVCGVVLTSTIVALTFNNSKAGKLVTMTIIAGLSWLVWPVIVIKLIGWIVVFPIMLAVTAVFVIPFMVLILGSAVSGWFKR